MEGEPAAGRKATPETRADPWIKMLPDGIQEVVDLPTNITADCIPKMPPNW